MTVYRTFRFHAARFLPNLKDEHICKKIHGHTFNLTVYISGPIKDPEGFVIDFFDVDKIVNKKILPLIDHKLLNDIENLSNPTSEYLIKWIWDNLINDFTGLEKLKLSEDHGTGIIYRGE